MQCSKTQIGILIQKITDSFNLNNCANDEPLQGALTLKGNLSPNLTYRNLCGKTLVGF